MAIGYYGTRISQRMTRTPEGFLVAHRVPIARTGWQDYTPSELGVNSDLPIIKVYRPEEEVFHPDTIRSFEGKDITDDHPGRQVDPASWAAFARGHMQNVHRGTSSESSYDEDMSDRLVADLVIKDQSLISKVEPSDGKREVSCGYNYSLHCFDCGRPYSAEGVEQDACKCLKPTRFKQRVIRGNHLAVVDAGRAGSSVRIQDTGELVMPEAKTPQEMISMPQGFFEKLFGSRFANDEEKRESKDEADRKARDARMDKICDWAEKQMADAAAAEAEKIAKDKKAKDKKAKDTEGEIAVEDAEEGEGEGAEEEKEHEAERTESSDLEPTEILPTSAHPFNPIPGADRAAQMAILNRMKPKIAATGDRDAIDTFNRELRRVKNMPTKSAADGKGKRSSYSHIAAPPGPAKKSDDESLGLPSQEKIADDYGKQLASLNGKGFAKLGMPN